MTNSRMTYSEKAERKQTETQGRRKEKRDLFQYSVGIINNKKITMVNKRKQYILVMIRQLNHFFFENFMNYSNSRAYEFLMNGTNNK